MNIKYEEKNLTQPKLLISKNRTTIRMPKHLSNIEKSKLVLAFKRIADKYKNPPALKATYKLGTPFLFLKYLVGNNTQTIFAERI